MQCPAFLSQPSDFVHTCAPAALYRPARALPWSCGSYILPAYFEAQTSVIASLSGVESHRQGRWFLVFNTAVDVIPGFLFHLSLLLALGCIFGFTAANWRNWIYIYTSTHVYTHIYTHVRTCRMGPRKTRCGVILEEREKHQRTTFAQLHLHA